MLGTSHIQPVSVRERLISHVAQMTFSEAALLRLAGGLALL